MADIFPGISFKPPEAFKRPVQKAVWFYSQLNFIALPVAIITLLVKYGFDTSPESRDVMILVMSTLAVFFSVEILLNIVFGGRISATIKAHWLHASLALTFFTMGILVPLAIQGTVVHNSRHYQAIVDLYVSGIIFLKFLRAQKSISILNLKPAQLFAISFALLILIGAMLLSLPKATPQGKGISFIDAIFMSTSATCVTGLTVKFPGSDFTNLGQGVLLGLIQIGGIGIMTFSAFFGLIIGKSMSIREKSMMKDVLNYEMLGEVGKILIYILLITFSVELVGAILLFDVWPHGVAPSILSRLKFSVFHAVSAFNNAGLSLLSNSLEDYSSSMKVNFVFMFLIVLGGLGFTVIVNLVTFRLSTLRLLKKISFFRKYSEHMPSSRLSLQTKVVLITTGVLIFSGAFLILIFESANPATIGNDSSLGRKLLVPLFHSVTSRTAGFDTVAIGLFTSPTIILTIFLMFIGASPGSTGGGIKTSTFTILLMTVWSFTRGRDRVEMYNRTVHKKVIENAIVVFVLSLLVIFVMFLATSLAEPNFQFQSILFEVISAFGTVGLSTGSPSSGLSLAADFGPLGKLIITLTMFVGRIGPLTLMLAMAQREFSASYEYPSERVMVG